MRREMRIYNKLSLRLASEHDEACRLAIKAERERDTVA